MRKNKLKNHWWLSSAIALSFFPISLVSCNNTNNQNIYNNHSHHEIPWTNLIPSIPSNPTPNKNKNKQEFYNVNYFFNDKLFKSEKIKSNSIFKPELIEKEGYFFDSYYLDKYFKNKLPNNLVITQDLNLYLRYFPYSNYSVTSLIDTIKPKTKNLKMLKDNDICYVEIKDFFNLIKEVTFIAQKIENLKFNENKYDLTKHLTYFNKNKELLINLLSRYQSKNKKNSDFSFNSSIKFDALNNQIIVSDYSFFKQINPYETESNLDFKYQDFKKQITIDLNKYNLKMLEINNQIYMPFCLLNLIVLNEYENAFYFNEKEVFLISYHDIHSAGNSFKRIKETLTKNNLDNKEMPKNLKEFQFNYLHFLLDNFYGIKPKNNESYLKLLSSYKNKFLGNNKEHYLALHDLINSLDDLHTKVLMQGLYEKEESYMSSVDIDTKKKNFKERVKKFYLVDDELYNLETQLQLEGKWIRNTQDNKTRIIRFDVITRETKEWVKKDLEQAEKDGIKNIVFDLTLNRGGSVQATYELLGFMSNEYFKYFEYNPLTNEKIVTQIKSNVGKQDFKYFILISPKTYSASNMLAATAKENKLAKIIGYKSAGGASIVRFACLPSGNILRLSSNNVLTNRDFVSYENGVIPDINFANDKNASYKNLFDLNYIENIVNKNS
ncbi:Hypothetical protein, predicted lipoprotein and peptidase [Metamycoplasma auris 15026]|uniref:Tail specific protease domain-containing protein n=1 Tax=Metamycoplasma auris 15026 TaxID=1188233 RepID=N9UZA0_9BACT|nr:S41 family peptidase [Metamycoplasma auris]ENY68522.1 Hypothetical protein, predicted lipoprotein and peptidase [Metamycoplasma auris 15026]